MWPLKPVRKSMPLPELASLPLISRQARAPARKALGEGFCEDNVGEVHTAVLPDGVVGLTADAEAAGAEATEEFPTD